MICGGGIQTTLQSIEESVPPLAGKLLPGNGEAAGPVQLGRQTLDDRAVACDVDGDAESVSDSISMQVVLKTSPSHHDGPTTGPRVDRSGGRDAALSFRRGLTIEEIELRQPQCLESRDPFRMTAAAKRNEDDVPVSFFGGQIRNGGIGGIERARDASEKLDVELTFDDNDDRPMPCVVYDVVRFNRVLRWSVAAECAASPTWHEIRVSVVRG